MDSGKPLHDSATIKAHSVKVFIRRVKIALTSSALIAIIVIFALVYLPLQSALKESLVENFSHMAKINFELLKNTIKGGIDSAKSISDKNMTRLAISDYRQGKIDFEQLCIYTQPRYEDLVKNIPQLIVAGRFVDSSLIAEYSTNTLICEECVTNPNTIFADELLSEICLLNDHCCLVVSSPIILEGAVIGHDRLVFCIKERIKQLSTDKISSSLITKNDFSDLLSDTKIVKKTNTSFVFEKDSDYYHADTILNAHFILKQSEASLFSANSSISIKILLVGIFIIITFITAVYFSIIRYAEKKLLNMEVDQLNLKQAAFEASFESLTGAGSRRYGTNTLINAFEKFKSTLDSPAIFMLDVDSLKDINDNFGHFAGDRVLSEVVSALRGNTRGEDMIFRWGGDEFVGIFYGVTKENINVFSEKLISVVRNLKLDTSSISISKITTNKSNPNTNNTGKSDIMQKFLRPTVSMGVSFFSPEDTNFSTALSRADRAMYLSKTKGKNRASIIY